jgi:putative transposase
MSVADEDRRRAARAEQVALFRYQLIREAADPELTVRQRGRMVRELAGKAHQGPFGEPVTVSRATIDRWIRAWRSGGFAALAPPARQVTLRTGAQVLELAAGLKREKPDRTAAQVQRVLRRTCGWSPSARTLQRHFGRLELNTRPDGRAPAVFGRFEAGRPNELWTGDALHGPQVAGRKAYLFCFLDDHSRAVMAARWGYFEDTVRLAAALRPALAARGVPDRIYVDNGSAFVDAALKRAAARLGIKITHSAPGRPQGRGKIERFFRVVREEFLVEIGDGAGVADLAELNRLFTAWYETVYHARPHGETGQPPIGRWLAGLAVAGQRPVPRPGARAAAGGVLVVRDAPGPQGRHDPPVRRRLRDQPGARGPEDRVRLRPIRPHRPADPLERGPARDRGPPEGRPAHPSQGETRGSGRPGARDRDRLPRHHQGRARGSRPPAPDPLRRPRHRRTGPGRAGGREVTAAVPAAQISAVLAWAARLAAAPAGTIETAAYLTAKASVLERIAAERDRGGWAPADITAARQAAARARQAADTAALLAAAGITAIEEDQ